MEPTRHSTSNSEKDFHTITWLDKQARSSARTVFWVLGSGVVYYLATRTAWLLCFPDSKVSLFFPPHAILVSVLLLVPTRHWWAYTLAAAASHFIATQQEDWPPLYALHCEAFDAVKAVLTAAGIRMFIRSPFRLDSLREAMLFVLVAVIIVPAATALWGAALTLSNRFGSEYWVEWRNLSISNAVTTIVLVPVILIAVNQLTTRAKVAPKHLLEASCLAAAIIVIGWLDFGRSPAGPDTSPALIYAPVPLLIWAALRFGLGGISASMLLITILAIWGTMHGRGPFLAQTPAENALALQLFLLVAATPLLLLAAAIEEERRSKEALRASEARMSLAAESARLAMWDWDVKNDRVWIQDEGLFGFEPHSPIDHTTLAGRVHPDDYPVRATAIQHALANGGYYESEFRVILPDGSVRWIAARGHSPGRDLNLAEEDVPPRILGVAMDITRQKEAAAEGLLQKEELAHLSRVASLSALSSSIAHELGQPLTSILINAQTGQHCISRDTPDLAEVRAIFKDIVDANRRALEIIDRLRTMLRRGTVSLQPVNVNESVEELLRLIHSDLNSRRVCVAKILAADLPLAMTDRVQLQQVVLNLFVNACDAMETIPPEDRILTVTTFRAESEVRIGVLDCGVGLPNDVENLFQPFHSTKEGGLGMGLSICRTLVTSHGGKLWAERRAGRGAAFYVALPVATQSA
ncbi:MAG TPA: MASE1 domain-containing protein [Steroidobacteraceae bacterium]|nr:MASE1 domain-containing protein [Steroidobacteraceae bacterium]